MSKNHLALSVKSLIEYSLKSGSIDFEYTGQSRAYEGIIFHQRIQKKQEQKANLEGYCYEKEVSFCETFAALDINITVRGRADGIIYKNGKVFIEEIKTTIKPLEAIYDNPLHIAQAKCYAYFYMLKNKQDSIWVLLTYCNTNTFEIKEYEYNYSFDELEAFFLSVLHEYAKWAKYLLKWKSERNETIKNLSFPFETYRPGQRDMSVAVYRTIERRKNIFLNAPTGIGKTISALFPSIKSLEQEKADKIFYLTAKTITRQAALNAVTFLEQKGLFAKTIVITAKEKACFLDTPTCNPISCQYANGHFDRINQALIDILKNENIIVRETIKAYAETHKVCPYEFCLDIALYSDIIICDYNYAFDKRIYLRRFFSETIGEYIFLVDEAHNLVDRAREMYSAEIFLKELKNAVKKIKKEGRELKNQLKELISCIKELSEEITYDNYGTIFETLPSGIYGPVRSYYQLADKWLAENRDKGDTDCYEAVLNIYFLFNHFLTIWQQFDEKYICYCEKDGADVIFKLFCAHPGGCLNEMLNNARSTVFFSASLTPLSYYKILLGANKEDYGIMLKSPFPKENIKVLICTQISTKYKKREKYYNTIADYIYGAIVEKYGNYLLFFPSYAYLDCVYKEFTEKYPNIKTAVQSPLMNEPEKEAFLTLFKEQTKEPFLGFAVLGGMFSESIDLSGDKLIGALIISVGLPKISFQRGLILDYFNKTEKLGFEYSYVYPGMNKVIQAGGRVIRTMTDKGIILLIDERFGESAYSKLFPELWEGSTKVYNIKAMKKALKDFWSVGIN